MYGAALPFAMHPPWPPHLLPPGCEPLGGGQHPLESSPVLKLKGLPFQATQADIAHFFDGFALLSAAIHHGHDGRPSGMAFCVFATPDEAARAMSRDRAYIGERFVKILRVPAQEMDEQLAAAGRHLPHGFGAYGGFAPGGYPAPGDMGAMGAAFGYGGGYGGYPPPMHDMSAYGGPRPGPFPGFAPPRPPHGGLPPFAGSHGHGPMPPPPQRGPAGLTVKMRGLPFRVSPEEVYAFFAGFACVPDTLHMGSDALGRPSGEGWLTFSSSEEAARAARERNRQYIGARFIELTVV